MDEASIVTVAVSATETEAEREISVSSSELVRVTSGVIDTSGCVELDADGSGKEIGDEASIVAVTVPVTETEAEREISVSSSELVRVS
jgi:hypothetical protein